MRLNKILNLTFTTIGILAANTSAAFATTTTATMAVTANVVSFCTIAATPLPFGVYSVGAISSTATLTVVCTATTNYTIGLDGGTTTGGTVATRLMTNGINTLQYRLYSDSTHSSNFNQTGAGTVSGSGTGSAQTITVYGQIVGGQNVSPGAYADLVTATLTY